MTLVGIPQGWYDTHILSGVSPALATASVELVSVRSVTWIKEPGLTTARWGVLIIDVFLT
ncbi:hypothetical protein LAD67_07870 [Escherichia coli]|nr:hypothetical protein [Escherichia coli]